MTTYIFIWGCCIILSNLHDSVPHACVADDDDDKQTFLRNHAATDSEIKILCSDLQVLGRSEFKQLLKWRLTVKKELEKMLKESKPSEDDPDETDVDEEEEEEQEEDLEDDLMKEMESIKTKEEKRLKREKKKRREQKLNARIRSAQLAQAEGIGEEAAGPESLFSLKGVKVNKSDNVTETNAPDMDDMDESDDDERNMDVSESDSDLDERRRRYDEKMDAYLEESYKDWKIRQRMTQGGALKKKRRRLGMEGELEMSDDSDSQKEVDRGTQDESDDFSGSDDDGDLLVSLEDEDAPKVSPADAWFSQDVFEGEEEASSSSEEEMGEEDDMSESDDQSGDEDKAAPVAAAIHAAPTNGAPPLARTKEDDFEVVPLSDEESDSAAEEFDDLDDNAKAEVLALAKKFIRRKSKGEIIEAAYNRYSLYVSYYFLLFCFLGGVTSFCPFVPMA